MIFWYSGCGNSRFVAEAIAKGISDEMGHTHRDFKAVLAKAGLELGGTFCFQMPETYLAMPGFHLDTPEGAERKISAAKASTPTCPTRSTAPERHA